MTDQTIAGQPGDGDDFAARMAEMVAEARSSGVDLASVLAAADGTSLREQLDLRLPVLRRDPKGTYGTWALYLRRLATGLPHFCPCVCLTCSAGTCRCTAGTHAEGCSPDADVDCGERMRAHGDDSVRVITRHHIADAAWWARRRAMQRTVVRNAKREAAGRVLHDHDGRGAQEAMVQACRWLWNEMRRDDVVPANVARDVRLPTRQEGAARSLGVPTGDDPALDGLILRHMVTGHSPGLWRDTGFTAEPPADIIAVGRTSEAITDLADHLGHAAFLTLAAGLAGLALHLGRRLQRLPLAVALGLVIRTVSALTRSEVVYDIASLLTGALLGRAPSHPRSVTGPVDRDHSMSLTSVRRP
ncbi:hypothetical protein [Geodermatophilus sp. URMC 63]